MGKEAFKNLRVEIQVTNLEDLASALAHIQLRHASWDPKQGFDICSSPDIMVDVSNGILNHKRILCKTHAAEFAVPEAETVASIQAIARVLITGKPRGTSAQRPDVLHRCQASEYRKYTEG